MDRAIKRRNCCLKTWLLFLVWRLSLCRMEQLCICITRLCYSRAISICVCLCSYTSTLCTWCVWCISCKMPNKPSGRLIEFETHAAFLFFSFSCAPYIHVKLRSTDAIFSIPPHSLAFISSCFHPSIYSLSSSLYLSHPCSNMCALAGLSSHILLPVLRAHTHRSLSNKLVQASAVLHPLPQLLLPLQWERERENKRKTCWGLAPIKVPQDHAMVHCTRLHHVRAVTDTHQQPCEICTHTQTFTHTYL